MKPIQASLELDFVNPQGCERVLHKSVTGSELRDKGMNRAIKHANEVSSEWSDKCYLLFLQYLKSAHTFKCEDFREWVKFKISSPPSLRAFAYVIVRATKEGLIVKNGYTQVENKKAHKANCCVWKTV